jgi:nucleoside 2-deoxyribosyltransferase
MKVYLTYQFKDADTEILKENLEAFSKLVEEATGWKTFVFFRDVQNWQKGSMNIKEVTARAMKALKECDAIIADASEKANGVYFEVGYAKALGKKVIIIHKEGTEANFLESLADKKIVYKDFDDLKEKLNSIRRH